MKKNIKRHIFYTFFNIKILKDKQQVIKEEKQEKIVRPKTMKEKLEQENQVGMKRKKER